MKRIRKAGVPDWPRRIFDHNDTYLRSLASSNFLLTKDPIFAILPDAVRTADKTCPADAIVFATGSESNKGLEPIKIYGRNDQLLDDHWREMSGPGAYNNTTIHAFPNFVLIYCPDSTTGHTSVIFAIESQVRYALQIIRPYLQGEAKVLDVKKDEERHYVEKIQEISKTRVFTHCSSLYLLTIIMVCIGKRLEWNVVSVVTIHVLVEMLLAEMECLDL
ncbi:hypothetical protein M422DRAFT_274278 [Sphaerobolus stellatus SS14]|uniref:Uncharacterized protein n=1 Tax=Sphaerobolus stellatus (strain SS14) TaxID=990650 RepID=A0A0C9T791_SPHS4|nr:hypothetical protein M422DRAFT_274278 [Sphaerobolus stellatus SS14]